MVRFDEYTLRLIEIAGSWVSGIGTISAVIVALHLAREERRPKLKISGGIRVFATPGVGIGPEFVAIEVANVGLYPVTLTSVGWKFGAFRKTHTVQIEFDQLSSQLPIELSTGRKAHFHLPGDPDRLANKAGRIDRLWPWLREIVALAL